MDLIHKLLNILLPPISIIAFLFTLPSYLAFKLLNFIKRSIFSENVSGKVVLVTGAASGIGEQISYEYARRGASLALVDINKDRLSTAVETARDLGSPDVIGISADISKLEDCGRFVQQAVNHFGRMDHLVNNAGIGRAKYFEDIKSITDFVPIMDINFWGTVYGTHFAIPHLRKRKGKIIVISSTLGWFPLPGHSIYNASKAALIGFYDTLRSEIGNEIGITIVTPGLIHTELGQLANRTLNGVPMESKEECAKAIVRSAVRGDKYLVEPSWVRSAYPWKTFCQDIVDWSARFAFKTLPKFSKRNVSSSNAMNESSGQSHGETAD